MAQRTACDADICFYNSSCMLNPIQAVINAKLSSYYDTNSCYMAKKFKKKVNAILEKHIHTLHTVVDQYLKKEVHLHDGYSLESVHSGMAGVALLYNLYATIANNKKQYRQKAKEIIEKCISTIDPNCLSITYISGTSGIYVTAYEIYVCLGDKKNCKKMIEKVVGLSKLAFDPSMTDGVLYGRAGYLYSLVLLRKMDWVDPKADKLIKRVAQTILNSGMECSIRNRPSKTPIMFKWQRRSYLGAAHGLAGVLHCLLQAVHVLDKDELNDLIKPALDYLLTLRDPSGNIPTSLCCETTDGYVQWCHGASGIAHTYALAYEVFKDNRYREAAEGFSEVVWNRGSLTRGMGLCHGISGNSFTFMSLYQATGKTVHLYRCAKFIEWILTCFDGNLHITPKFASSHSLFEGITGVLYTLLDMQDIQCATFPGF